MHLNTNRNSRILLLAISLALAACGGEPQQQEQGVPTVGVITAVPELVVVTTEMSGRLEPWRIAEVRAQVSGIVESRDFAEGSDVKAGQKLFQIDPAPYQASVNEAESNLAVARANLLKAKAQYDRIAALGKVKAVSELDEITAQATFRQAEAGVAAAQAAVESARIDLARATVRAPIDGRAGRSLVTEGALVRQEDATHLTTIQQIQPIYASFDQSAADALKLRNSFANKTLDLTGDNAIPVRLILEDGSRYPHEGRLLFGEVNVDPATGQIDFRAQIPNPDRILLPGMYVRVVVEQARFPEGFLIPQKAVTRNEHGDTVLVVGEGDVVEVRPVTIAGAQNNQWIITEGLEGNERVMVDGFFKAPPGTRVKPLDGGAQNAVAGE
ncbi:MAG: efflux RND transporter periplasmic adaptor subunit [Porticoccaceae bacterium]|jgi:membrane fusion protein (multidrug efflux system)|nr:efflux RND transporter periplasmic adaptor subunit [Porticoccaceae bacterium]